MWVRISFTSDEEQSQNKHTASNPEGPVHSAHSLQCIITKHYLIQQECYKTAIIMSYNLRIRKKRSKFKCTWLLKRWKYDEDIFLPKTMQWKRKWHWWVMLSLILPHFIVFVLCYALTVSTRALTTADTLFCLLIYNSVTSYSSWK